MSDFTNRKNIEGDAFDLCPGFYLSDNRKNRHFNPVTKEMLIDKLGVLLPPEFVRGKRILDLGSCLGAAGQWALYYGALSYTGVELQERYAFESKKLLGPWGGRASVHQQGIRDFIEEAEEEYYDIIVMAGVLYLFVDPFVIIEKMCRIAKHAVVIETNYSPSIRAGKLPIHAAITEYLFDQEVNLAGGNESLLGISATSSPRALDLMFGLSKFTRSEEELNFPCNKNMINYSAENMGNSRIPLRYAVRYIKNNSMRMSSLESNIAQEKGFRRSWKNSRLSKIRTIERNKILHQFDTDVGSWKFDENIAMNFLKIAEREIPDYHRVIDKTIEMINKCDFKNPKIIDVGSALGETLKRLHGEGYRNLYGMDNSKAMISRSFKDATLICSHDFPVEFAPFDVVIANWVLHFIEQRDEYLLRIKKALSHNGILILTEKLTSSSLAHSVYDDFKRRNGLSNSEISKKRKQLEGVLVPHSLEWYMSTFSELGFDNVDIINANMVFVTFLIQVDRR